MGCVYIVTNLINQKQYVGQTKNFKRRQVHHLYYAKNNIHSTVFTQAINKYGEDNFKWEIIFESNDQSEINQREIDLISQLGTLVPNGYNMLTGGDVGDTPIAGQNHWNWKGGPVIVNCQVCGIEMEVSRRKFNQWQKAGAGFNCSKECFSANQTTKRTGSHQNRRPNV